jgi:hypothetical protein
MLHPLATVWKIKRAKIAINPMVITSGIFISVQGVPKARLGDGRKLTA